MRKRIYARPGKSGAIGFMEPDTSCLSRLANLEVALDQDWWDKNLGHSLYNLHQPSSKLSDNFASQKSTYIWRLNCVKSFLRCLLNVLICQDVLAKGEQRRCVCSLHPVTKQSRLTCPQTYHWGRPCRVSIGRSREFKHVLCLLAIPQPHGSAVDVSFRYQNAYHR